MHTGGKRLNVSVVQSVHEPPVRSQKGCINRCKYSVQPSIGGRTGGESIQWDVCPQDVMVSRGKTVILLISVLLFTSLSPLRPFRLNPLTRQTPQRVQLPLGQGP